MRITTSTSNQEYKITRLSELPCNLQKFTLKKKGCESGQDDPEEITVYDYFVNRQNIALAFSAALPCINVGKPNRSVYIPIEALKNMNYNSEPMIHKCGISTRM
ncbi:unnamed protein product [Lathyrus sativus]|nr:unnamed protein product [Lathyrus sativus]